MKRTTQDPGYLSQTDAIMWMVEADPLLRSTILGVVLLDRSPDWDRLVERVERVTRQVPGLRHKVVRPPLHPTLLRWEVDGDFDIYFHLRRVALAAPAGREQVLEFARHCSMQGFDRARPLWEFTLIEGLEHGAAALVMKVHHVLTDGVGSVQLAAYLFDFEVDADGSGAEPPPAPAADGHDFMSRLRDVVEHDVEGLVDFARRNAPSAVPNLLHAIRHPQQAIADTVSVIRSIGRTVAPNTETLSPIMTERHLATCLRTMDVPLKHLHDAAKVAGGTVNDGFLAGISGGLRRYHELHGAEVDELRVSMPINLRTKDDAAGGNHVTVMRFKVPVGLSDAAERIAALHALGQGIRAEPSLAYTGVIAGALNLLPKQVIGSMLKHVDFLASNVPGVPIPMYLLGAEVQRFYPFGPTAGSAVNITLMSYRDTCCLGVNIDAKAIVDHDVFMDCLRAGFDEVLDLEPKVGQPTTTAAEQPAQQAAIEPVRREGE